MRVKKSAAFVLICLASAMAFSALSTIQVSGADYTKLGVIPGDWATYTASWPQGSASIKIMVAGKAPGFIRFYETDSYANGTSTDADYYQWTTQYNSPDFPTLFTSFLSFISPSPNDYQYPVFIASNLSSGDHIYPPSDSEPFNPEINSNASESILDVERQVDTISTTNFSIKYDQKSGILVSLVIKQPYAVSVTISETNLWSSRIVLELALAGVGVTMTALAAVLVVFEKRKKTTITPSPPSEEISRGKRSIARAKPESQVTTSDSSSASKASIRRKLIYVLIFSFSIRFIIFSFAVVFGNKVFNVLGFSDLESYEDFGVLYVHGVDLFAKWGLMPYQQLGYAYPPFFLYLMTPFELFSLPSWTMALPLVFLDGATVIPVFLIANKLMNPKKAVIASMAFAVAPINLYYNDFLWLNSSPVTFFVLLAVYWFISKKHEYAFFCLAIATLLKQTAFILFPVFAVALINESNRTGTVRNVAVYGTACFIGSLPYIVWFPASYFSWLGLGFVASGAKVTEYSISYPTNLGWVFGIDGYSAFMPYLQAVLLFSLAALCLAMYWNRMVGDKRFVTCVLYALLLLNALFARGVYKYYLATIAPLGAVFVGSLRTAALFLGLNVLLLVLPRILTPWFVLVSLILLLVKDHFIKHLSWPSIRRVKDSHLD
jgi:hypothetical protein